MALTPATVGGKILASLINAIEAVANQIALARAIPTVSGTGMSVGTDGTITLTAASGALKILNCNSTFKTVIDIYLPANTANSILLQMADVSGTAEASGVAGSSGLYDRQTVQGSSATPVAGQLLKQTSWQVGNSSTQHHFQIVLFGANAATATIGTSISGDTQNPMTTSSIITLNSIQHDSLVAYPSVVITPSAAITSGVIKVSQG